ncbi:histidine phosphatase family protein [Bifidobacterium pullorum subsp. saeculare]|uniref:Histidine phosphatase family protein n=1 Tax=Bifidobacterium pullorum subsp. saeculare TaxID=78257 RepID=A0A939BA88_9BIFI|nr:histidine phosphatase family protein [Bifidobacterium pullorum]MBM6700070.1 histidine phosphatase family protein [Bifidobacterium pullorum subsp. saeculare]
MTETKTYRDGAVAPGRLVLLRHGQTAWSESGQHTGRTDIPLTGEGERQAEAAGDRLRAAYPGGFDAAHVFVSPLRRAQQTADLAGFPDHRTVADLAEWDYGRAEGRTRGTVKQASGFDWELWQDGPRSLPEHLEGDWTETLPSGEQVPVHAGAGESVEDVAARARRVIALVDPLLDAGEDVLLVAHAHVLRILTSQWLDLEPRFGRLLRLDTARYSVLGRYKGDNVIVHWNL